MQLNKGTYENGQSSTKRVRKSSTLRYRIMDRSQPPHEAFEIAVAKHFEQLKELYAKQVEDSDDKEYARDHYKQELLDENPLLPFGTVFFEKLTAVFDHYYRLNKSTAIERTIAQLQLIRQASNTASDQLTMAIISNECYPEDLAECYVPLWNRGVKLETLAERERRICETNEEGLIHKLAIHVAVERLRKHFDESEPAQRIGTRKENYKHTFKQSQQVLFMYYLYRLGGIEPRYNADMTVCTEIMHGIGGIPYNNIINSELYKKLGKPLDNVGKKLTLQNLRFVRSYFERLDHPRILELIDRDIRELEEN